MIFMLQADNLEVLNSTFADFGKSLLKSIRIHPDTCVQMALQLAYYRIYKKSVIKKMSPVQRYKDLFVEENLQQPMVACVKVILRN